MIKDLYCISEAPSYVCVCVYIYTYIYILKFELWFIIRDVDFPRKQWFSLCEDL